MASKMPKSRITIEDALRKLSDDQLAGEFDDIFKLMPVTDDTSCGAGFLSGISFQK